MSGFVARSVEFRVYTSDQYGIAGHRRLNDRQALAHGWLPGALAQVPISLPLTPEEADEIMAVLDRAAARVVAGILAGHDDAGEEGA